MHTKGTTLCNRMSICAPPPSSNYPHIASEVASVNATRKQYTIVWQNMKLMIDFLNSLSSSIFSITSDTNFFESTGIHHKDHTYIRTF